MLCVFSAADPERFLGEKYEVSFHSPPPLAKYASSPRPGLYCFGFPFSPLFCFFPAEAEIFPPFPPVSFYRGVVPTLFFSNQFAEAPSPPFSQPRLGCALREHRPAADARGLWVGEPGEAMPRSGLSREEPPINAVRADPRAQPGRGERQDLRRERRPRRPSIAPRGNRVGPGAARGALPSCSPHRRSPAGTRGPSPNETH